MTDLHTRIAQVLYARHQAKLAWGQPWDDLRDTVQQSWLDTADAVIAELQPELNRHDTGCTCQSCWLNHYGKANDE